MKYKVFNFLPSYGTNTYLVWDEKTKEALLIDYAAPDKQILSEIKNLNLKYIVCTHGHGDHIAGNDFIKKNSAAELLIHSLDAEMLTDPALNLSMYWEGNVLSPKADRILKDKDVITLGEIKFEVIHTPGHTKGGICLLAEDKLFCGDTLFADGIGRTDLPGGDQTSLISSIKKKLFALDDEIEIFPGHGPRSSIGKEKIENPYVGYASKF